MRGLGWVTMKRDQLATGLMIGMMLVSGAKIASAAAILSVGTVVGAPGSTVTVPVNLMSDTNVAALQFDLLYDSNYVTPGAVQGGPALADQGYGSNIRSPGDYTVLMYTFTYNPMSNGVIAFIPFSIASNTPDTNVALTFTNYILIADAALDFVNPVTAPTGTLSIATLPVFTAVTRSADRVAHVTLAGSTNRSYVIQGATNLVGPVQWTALSTNAATNGEVRFDDPAAATIPTRYYRAMVAP